MLSVVLIALFILCAFSFVRATIVLQKYKAKLTTLLNSNNEAISKITKLIINESLSFFSIYRLMFKKKKKSNNTTLTVEEKEAVKILAEAYINVNFSAYWYNYLVIICIMGVWAIFKNINFKNIFNLERQIFILEKNY